jgi:2,3-diketo-5-methylthiopentyl-1-phosphate enolase
MVDGSGTVSVLLDSGTIGDGFRFFDVGVALGSEFISRHGLTGLLSFLAGDIFGAPYAKDLLVLVDIALPREMAAALPGPRFGSEGVLQRVPAAQESGFLLGLLLKPDLGVGPCYYADLAEAAAQAGVDYIKEDELTMDLGECPRFRRIEAVARRLQKVGREVIYAANATAPAHRLLRTASDAVQTGATAVLVNGLFTGLDAISQLASDGNIGVPIHNHRAGYDLLSTGPKAISVPCLTSLFRMAGADVVHVGSPLGGLFSEGSVCANCNRLSRPQEDARQALPVFSRSSEESLAAILDAGEFRPGVALFDAWVYQHPLGLEKAVLQLRRLIDAG